MKQYKGFGLLEILITLVLLGVGVAGLVAMSRGLLGSSQDGRRYEVAMRLAESKLDEFRTFNGVVSAVSPLTAYISIAAGSTTTTPTNGGGSYSLSWTVSNQYWNGTGWSATMPAGYLYTYPGRKIINVTVGWSDSAGQARSLLLSGAVSPTESLATNQMQGGGLDTSRPKPKVTYTPGAVPDVVSVDLGNGSKKETSKPLPHITGNAGTSRLIQFDSITYQTQGDNNNKQSLQDTASVLCSCSTSGTPEKAYLPGIPYYSATDKVQYWKVGEQVVKSVGGLSGNNKQEPLCASCCREHYDVADKGFSGYFSPLNMTRGRYRLSGSSLQAVTSGDYIDACRFVRLDGTYRPAPDWHLVSLTTFSSTFLNDTTNLANYQAYIAYVIREHVKWQKSAFSGKSDASWSAVTSSPAIQTFNTWLANNRAGSPNTDLTTPIGTVQLISRGIYVDIMSPSYLTNEVFKGAVTEPDIAKVPFQDVNMTLLNEWSSDNSTKLTVTSQPIATVVDPEKNYYGTYSRGRLTANASTYSGNPPTSNSITITAKSYQGNSGVVGSPILPEDITDAIVSTVKVNIQDSAQSPRTNINGVIKCLDLNTTYIGSGKDRVTVNSAVPCTQTSKNLTDIVSNSNVTCSVQDIGAPAEASYSCSGPAGSFFTLMFSKNKYQFVPAAGQQLTLPTSGTLPGGCVLMVSNDLKNAIPAPTPAIQTSCDIAP
ncbi:prepilin-type N-terminal cleavage/methylation domain-containing protein [Aeromonas veronii]